MEIRQLKYFIMVAEELHFGRAARKLNISQPPLSRQIAQLETEMGVQLLKRTNRFVELTEAGKSFLEDAHSILHSLDRACNRARKIHEGEAGQLVIGIAGSWSSALLRFLRYYRTKFPEIEVLIHQMSTMEQLRAFEEKRIHFGILCPPIDSQALHLRVIHSVPFYVALPSSHPLAGETAPIQLKALKKDPFIMSPRNIGPGYYDTIISICRNAGFSPRIAQEAEGLFTILTLVAAGIGVSLVSELALEHPKEGVVFRALEEEDTKMELTLAWRKDESSPIVEQFLQSFEEMFDTV